MNNKKRFEKICRDIKEIKIQGATNIAKAAIYAYSMNPSRETKKILIGLRPTEPMLVNALHNIGKIGEKKVIAHFSEAQEKINKNLIKIIKNGMVIYTHCHSTNVVKALIYARRKGKKFEVYNTETRPLYQGRITSKELSRAGIKVSTFVDSGMHDAIEDVDIVLLGADAILKNGIINKIGSAAVGEIAFVHKKPVYVAADSWKFSPKLVKLEERDFHEVWKNAPKKIKIMNPAFEKLEKKYIKGIISEYGILKYGDFLKRVEKR